MACSNIGASCYDFAGDPPSLGCYIDCVLPNIFDVISVIFVAIAIAMTLWLIFQTIRNSENQEFLQTVGKRWVLLILFIIIVATRGGIIFIPLKFLGFEGLTAYDSFYQGFIDMLDVTRNEGGNTPSGNNDTPSSNNDTPSSNNDTPSGNPDAAPGNPDTQTPGGDKNAPQVDTDGDGVPDDMDEAVNDPCKPSVNNSACKIDSDNDGTPDNQDSNVNDPCVPDNNVGVCDKDKDGLLNNQESSTNDADLDGTVDRDDPRNDDPCVPNTNTPACNILKEPEAAAICQSLSYCQDGSQCTALECLNCWDKGFITKPSSCN